MLAIVEVSTEGGERPPLGAPIRVEARDTALADAAATTVASATGAVRGQHGSWLDTVELDVPTLPDHCTIWAHVDVDRDGRVGRGDFITTVAYLVPSGAEARVPIRVRRV